MHSFEGSWFGKKTDDVRFRLHRFLGILMLYKQENSAVGRGFVIDYHTAFPYSSKRKVLDDKLRTVKSLMQTPASIASKPDDVSAFVGIVSDCLQLIGEFTNTKGGVIQYSTTVENWNVFRKVLNAYTACVDRKLKDVDESNREAVCNGIRLLLRESSDALTRWHHAGMFLDLPQVITFIGGENPVTIEKRARMIADLSLYGQAAQVLECFKAGGKAFDDCRGETLRPLQGILFPATSASAHGESLCDVYPNMNLIRIVRVFFCVRCESPKPENVSKSPREIVAECTQKIQKSDVARFQENEKVREAVTRACEKKWKSHQSSRAEREFTLDDLIHRVYGQSPGSELSEDVLRSLTPETLEFVEQVRAGNVLRVCLFSRQKDTFETCLTQFPRDQRSEIISKLSACFAAPPGDQQSCILQAKLRERHVSEIETAICMMERKLVGKKADDGVCDELNSYHEYNLSLSK